MCEGLDNDRTSYRYSYIAGVLAVDGRPGRELVDASQFYYAGRNALDKPDWLSEVGRMKRLALDFVLMLALGVAVMSGCTTPSTREELELTTYDPAQDHQKIAVYYRHEAAKMREAVQQMSVRIGVYERLFGPRSDWVAGTRLLTQSYEDIAQEYERKAREHVEGIHTSQPPVGAGFGSR